MKRITEAILVLNASMKTSLDVNTEKRNCENVNVSTLECREKLLHYGS
jgi:hypothetical protein